MRATTENLPARVPAPGHPLTGWTVLSIILMFFGTVAGVNGAMIYCALSTFSGEVDPSPYEHGLAYDKDIAAAHAQDARHWSVDGTLFRPAPGAVPRVEITMLDADGRAVAGLDVAASVQFATDKALDRSLRLTETAAGRYGAEAAIPPGRWDLILDARREGDVVFRSHSRLQLR